MVRKLSEKKLEKIVDRGVEKGILENRTDERGVARYELTELGKLSLENKGKRYVAIDLKTGKIVDTW